ncbi:MAG: efflux RND transporter periplasmic adaptor subunit [Puniceicoccaceae bacterium]|nr:MAG: efflux RND transporter periplasmic adaptor subunit [Puniceicoccaceae bacterium]
MHSIKYSIQARSLTVSWLAIVLSAGWGMTLSAQPADRAIPVVTTPVELAEAFTDTIEALGTAKANESVVITANVTEVVEEILFDDGDQVRKGQVLLRLRQDEEQASLKAAQARLDERLAAFGRAQDLERQQALSTAALQERQALLRQVEGEIEVIQSQINDRVIRAPFDGVLGLRNISVGALVRPGDPITTIDDLSQIKVDFEAPSIFLSALRPGLRIEGRIRAFPGRVFEGEVRNINTRIDPATRTVSIRAILPNEDGLLRPGLLVAINLAKNPRNALLIPEGAVIQRGRSSFVYRIVEGDDGPRAVETEIKPGTRVTGKIEVLDGITAEDRLVNHGLMQIRDGAKVRILGNQTGPDQALSDFLQDEPVQANPS